MSYPNYLLKQKTSNRFRTKKEKTSKINLFPSKRVLRKIRLEGKLQHNHQRKKNKKSLNRMRKSRKCLPLRFRQFPSKWSLKSYQSEFLFLKKCLSLLPKMTRMNQFNVEKRNQSHRRRLPKLKQEEVRSKNKFKYLRRGLNLYSPKPFLFNQLMFKLKPLIKAQMPRRVNQSRAVQNKIK